MVTDIITLNSKHFYNCYFKRLDTLRIKNQFFFILYFPRNFKLLSFGEEAEEDEEESARENEKYIGKGKSTHDVLGKIHKF